MSCKEIKRKRDWDDIWFQMRPRKTINYPSAANPSGVESPNTPAPTQIQVDHFDFNTLGLTLLQAPPFEVPGRPVPDPASEPEPLNELKVMLLLKV